LIITNSFGESNRRAEIRAVVPAGADTYLDSGFDEEYV
jgi:hypothetical protein